MKRLFFVVCAISILCASTSCAGGRSSETKEENSKKEVISESIVKKDEYPTNDGYDTVEELEEMYFRYLLGGCDSKDWCTLIPDDIEEDIQDYFEVSEEYFESKLEIENTGVTISDFKVKSTREMTEEEYRYNYSDGYSYDEAYDDSNEYSHCLEQFSMCEELSRGVLWQYGMDGQDKFFISYISYDSSEQEKKIHSTCVAYKYKERWYSYGALIHTLCIIDSLKEYDTNKDTLLSAEL